MADASIVFALYIPDDVFSMNIMHIKNLMLIHSFKLQTIIQ